MTFLYSIFIILATSTLTATFSFWRYRSERWWELKVQTYSKAMEALHYIKKRIYMDYEDYYAAMNAPPTHEGDIEYDDYIIRKNPDAVALLRQTAETALEEIERIIDAASFIMKQEALNELIKLQREYQQPFDIDDPDDLIDKNKKLITCCLSNVRVIAKNDLETIPDTLTDKINNWIKKRKT